MLSSVVAATVAWEARRGGPSERSSSRGPSPGSSGPQAPPSEHLLPRCPCLYLHASPAML